MTRIKIKGCKLYFAVKPNNIDFTTLYQLGGYTSENEITSNSTSHQGAYIVGNTGADSNSAKPYWGRTDYIEIDDVYKKFSWQGNSGNIISTVSYGLVMFYDAEKHLVGAYCLQKSDGTLANGVSPIIKVYEQSELPITAIEKSAIPAGAKYVRACTNCGDNVEFHLTLYKN